MVHTTGKAQRGGVQAGLARVSYHAPGLNTAPLEATAMQAAKKPISARVESLGMTNL